MAKKSNTVARIDVVIGGTEEANKKLDALKKRASELYEELKEAEAEVRKQSDETGKHAAAAYDRSKARVAEINAELKPLEKNIRSSQNAIRVLGEYLDNISGETLRHLNDSQRVLKSVLQNLRPEDSDKLKKVQEMIKMVGDEINRRKGTLQEYEDIIGNIGNVSDKSLGMVKNRLQDLIGTTEKGSDKMKEFIDQLRKVEEEQQRRKSQEAGAVMGNLQDYSLNEINAAIKATIELRDAQKLGSDEWEIYSQEIEKAKKYIEDYNKLESQLAMSDRMKSLGTASSQSLAEIEKFWRAQVEGASQGSNELSEYRKNLNAVIAEQQKRKADQAGAVMGNLSGSSVKDIQDAIKATTELRDAQSRGSVEWSNYNQQIENAQKYLKAYDEQARRAAIEDKMKTLGDVSKSGLEEAKKYWQEMANQASNGSNELNTYLGMLQKVEYEEQRRKSDRASQIGSNLTSSSESEIREYINLTKELQQHVQAGSSEWEDMSLKIKEAEDMLKSFNENVKKGTMEKQLRNVSDLSKDALESQKKYWQSQVDGAQNGSAAMMQYKDNLDTVIEEENRRIAEMGKQAIREINIMASGTSKATIGDIKKMKKALEEYRNTLNITEVDNLNEIDEALKEITHQEKIVTGGMVDIDRVIKNIRTVPLEKLKAAASQLQEELEGMVRGTKEYVKTSAELRKISSEIEDITKEWKEHDNALVSVVKRLAAYVAVYGSFNFVLGKLKEIISANLELSDSMADVQKTTGLTAEEVSQLSKDIDSIDTRTAQNDLYQLAATAGQIGLKSQQDILGFVKASNMLTVSLNELGSEGTASLMKLAQLTGDVQKMGVERSLNAIASSINELSANSSANAGPIADFMGRVGGISYQANLASADIAALGATADALGQSMEIAGTSMNKFIPTLLSKTDEIAYALNMDAKALRDLIDSGKTMEAIIEVFRKMESMGGIGELAPIMGDLGSEGARMTQLLSAMAGNVDLLTEQVEISRKAFAEGTSIINEYNVKNNNAIAILERMGNTIREMFVNSGFVDWLKAVLVQMNNFVNWMAKGETGARTLKAAIIALGTAIVLSAAKLDSFVKAMFSAQTYTVNLRKAWILLTQALKTNWFSLLIGALTSLVYWLYQTKTYVSELTKETARYQDQLDKEVIKINALFAALKNANTKESERRDIIKSINEQYSKYIGFQISDLDSTEKLTKAKSLLVAEMRKLRAAQLKEQLTQNVDQQYSDRTSEQLARLQKQLQYTRGIGSELAPQAMGIISNIINNNITRPVNEIIKLIDKDIREKFDLYQGVINHYTIPIVEQNFSNIKEYAKELIKTRKEWTLEVEGVTAYASQELKSANEEVRKQTVELLKQLNEEYNKQISASMEGMNEQQVQEHYRNLIKAAGDYVSAAKTKMGELTDDEKKKVDDQIGFYEKQIETFMAKLPKEDAWGKALNLKGWKETFSNMEKASVDNLVKIYKELEKAPQVISDVTKYNQMFGTSFSKLNEVMEDTRNKAKQVKDELASRGRNTSGGFLWNDGSGRSGRRQQKEANDMIKAALDRLEQYYLEREAIINKAYNNEEITSETRNAKLDALETEHLKAGMALRRRLTGEMMTEQDKLFDLTHITKLSEEELDRLQKFLGGMGDKMMQQMLRKVSESKVKLEEILINQRKEIEKLLMDKNYQAQVDKEMQEWFEKTGLFWGKEIDKDEKNAAVRLSILREFSENAYKEDENAFKERLLANSIFGEEIEKMSKDQYDAFLVLLRQYHDKTIEADKKNADERMKIFNQRWEDTGNKDTFDSVKTEITNRQENVETIYSKGMMTENTYMDTSRDIILEQIAAEQIEFEARRQMMEELKVSQKDMDDLNRKHLESVEEYNNKLMDLYMHRYEKMAEITESYGTIIGDGFAKMVTGQEGAGEELVKNLLKETINMASEFAKRLILQQTFGNTMLQIKSQQNAAEQAIGQAAAAQNVATKIKEMTAIEAIEGGKITAQSMAQPDSIISFGASGAARAATIMGLVAAATAAALALVDSLFGSSSPAASASKRKFTSGMLTYADGKYPVLGDDGQVYNAKYESQLKTGVYSGGPRMAIFSEKKPEMVIDGDTTRHIMLNEPEIYTRIMQVAAHRRKRNAIRTYADGYYPEPSKITPYSPTGENDAYSDSVNQIAQMQEMMNETKQVMNMLYKQLQNPIRAEVNMYGSGNLYEKMEKAHKLMNRRNR